jgi:hypothetical protein
MKSQGFAKTLAKAVSRGAIPEYTTKNRKRRQVVMTNGNVAKASWYVPDAWRAVLAPDAIIEALAIGEQTIQLLTQTISLVERAYADMNQIIDNAHLRRQTILNQLYGQADRLDLVLRRLRSVGKAVTS